MPGYDGTGPEGKGPMTGRGRGYCIIPTTEKKEPTYRPRFRPFGLGRGRGRGFGRGFGHQSDINPRGLPRPRDGRGRW
ncbi:MAG: DUF5320 domain-containing protein [Candidatus Aenigmarchaeota archaeon]|nr:DUF5320 domain-containing protein [Candidatus Aenigmarchaeota archaeon]